MKLFKLIREEDVSGVNGKGYVAQGVMFDDGTCAMRWLTQFRSVAFYQSIVELKQIHEHNGATRVEWIE